LRKGGGDKRADTAEADTEGADTEGAETGGAESGGVETGSGKEWAAVVTAAAVGVMGRIGASFSKLSVGIGACVVVAFLKSGGLPAKLMHCLLLAAGAKG